MRSPADVDASSVPPPPPVVVAPAAAAAGGRRPPADAVHSSSWAWLLSVAATETINAAEINAINLSTTTNVEIRGRSTPSKSKFIYRFHVSIAYFTCRQVGTCRKLCSGQLQTDIFVNVARLNQTLSKMFVCLHDDNGITIKTARTGHDSWLSSEQRYYFFLNVLARVSIRHVGLDWLLAIVALSWTKSGWLLLRIMTWTLLW